MDYQKEMIETVKMVFDGFLWIITIACGIILPIMIPYLLVTYFN